MPEEGFQKATLWLGTSTYETPLHLDKADNFIVMLAGEKALRLAPPTAWRDLEPRCGGEQCWAFGSASASANASAGLDAESSGALRRVPFCNVTLRAGEILYLPAGWFHQVANRGPTVMLNLWTKGAHRMAVER